MQELPFTRYPMKYLVTSPDTLQDIVMNQLLQSHADVHTHTPTPLAACCFLLQLLPRLSFLG